MFTHLITANVKTLIAGWLLVTGSPAIPPGDSVAPASFRAGFYVTADSRIRVSVEKSTADPVTISLHTPGKSRLYLFSQRMPRKQLKLTLQLDVSALPDGVYELEVASSSSHTIRQISLTTPTRPADVIRTLTLPPVTDTRLSLN